MCASAGGLSSDAERFSMAFPVDLRGDARAATDIVEPADLQVQSFQTSLASGTDSRTLAHAAFHAPGPGIRMVYAEVIAARVGSWTTSSLIPSGSWKKAA
jgi:hypothetical protein